MQRVILVIISALILSTPSGSAHAEKHPPRRTHAAPKAAPKPDPIRLLVGAIALNTVQPGADLYSACRHADFKLLAWGLEGVKDKISLEKSEYETEAEFAERRSKLEGILNAGGEVIVCQPLNDNEDAPFHYDAERQVFSGTIGAQQNVWRDVKKLGTYVSKTRAGIRATVTSSLEMDYDVDMTFALSGKAAGCVKSNYGSYEYEVPSLRDDAPALKSRGYLVFVGKLVAPFISVSDSPGEPTLDDPNDVFERTLKVYFAPRLVAVVGPGGVQPWECKLVD